MASIKNLKKNIHLLCDEIVADCINCMRYHPAKMKEIKALVDEIESYRQEVIQRIYNHDGKTSGMKIYYRALFKEFVEKKDEIVMKLSNLIEEKKS